MRCDFTRKLQAKEMAEMDAVFAEMGINMEASGNGEGGSEEGGGNEDGGGDEKGEESPMDGLIGWTRLGKKRRVS